MANRKTERTYENILCVAFIAVYSFLIREAFAAKTFKVNGMKSMTFPKGIFFIMIAFCAIKFIMNIVEIIRDGKTEEHFERLHPVKLLTLAMIIVYAACWNLIGFGLSSIVFITLESKLLRKNISWLKCFLVGACFTAVIYIIFGIFFNVDFPEPILNLVF